MMTMDAKVHPFEKSGLGVAPFRCVGMFEKVYVACPGAPALPAGTCDHCGTSIRYCFMIRDAKEASFVVGCDCVRKLSRADNRLVEQVERQMKAVERKHRQEKRAVQVAKEEERIAKAFAALDASEAAQAAFKAMPHPKLSHNPLLTALDYIAYLRKYAGHSGQLAAARMIEKVAV